MVIKFYICSNLKTTDMNKTFIKLNTSATSSVYINVNQIISISQALGKTTITVKLSDGDFIQGSDEFNTWKVQFEELFVAK